MLNACTKGTSILYFKSRIAAATALIMTVSSPAFAQEDVSWTGLYVGVGVSGTHVETDQYSQAQHEFSAYDILPYGGKHLYGFVQAGGDVQLGDIVLGAQVRHERTNSDGDSYWKVDELISANAKNLTTLSARAGYLVKPKLLAYAQAGVTFGRMTYGSVDERWGLVADNVDKNRTGVTFGAGVEYRLTKKVSLLAEYNRTQFATGRATVDYGDAFPNTWTYDYKHKLDSVKAGVNFRF